MRSYSNERDLSGAALLAMKRARLITRIVAGSGNPRSDCWRFARQLGVTSKRNYRQWTNGEQQKLRDLTASSSIEEVTLLLRRSDLRCAMFLRLVSTSFFSKDQLAPLLFTNASANRVPC